MGRLARVAGTGYEDRAALIRKYCKEDRRVELVREYENQYDQNAIAVYLLVPRLFGLFGYSKKKIGYLKEGVAKSLANKIDNGLEVVGYVNSYYAPKVMTHPRVSIELVY